MKKPFEGDYYLHVLMEQIIARHSINIVVETGTETGASTEAFAKMVDTVYTVDTEVKLDRDLPANVTMHVGDSAKFLDMLLPDLCTHGKVLFFLDAHVAPTFTRVLDELDVISTQGCPDLVVVLHDYQVPDHPELGYDTYDGLGPLCENLVRDKMDKLFPGGWKVEHNSVAEGAKRGVAIFSAI